MLIDTYTPYTHNQIMVFKLVKMDYIERLVEIYSYSILVHVCISDIRLNGKFRNFLAERKLWIQWIIWVDTDSKLVGCCFNVFETTSSDFILFSYFWRQVFRLFVFGNWNKWMNEVFGRVSQSMVIAIISWLRIHNMGGKEILLLFHSHVR